MMPWLAKNGHVQCSPEEALPLKEAYIRLHAEKVKKTLNPNSKNYSQHITHHTGFYKRPGASSASSEPMVL